MRAIRPAADEHAPYYSRYISKVADGDIVATLERQIGDTLRLLRAIEESRGGHRYADGKWSIREVVGHMSDTERVFTYRAVRFARNDATPLPGYDENHFVANARFDARTVRDLADELEAVRGATIAFFSRLDDDEWQRRGTANDTSMSVRAVAWIVAGHELHHLGILTDRYL
jgi:uncharacterized damage-inducible protein DinB